MLVVCRVCQDPETRVHPQQSRIRPLMVESTALLQVKVGSQMSYLPEEAHHRQVSTLPVKHHLTLLRLPHHLIGETKHDSYVTYLLFFHLI
jgi:hypothetical protein